MCVFGKCLQMYLQPHKTFGGEHVLTKQMGSGEHSDVFLAVHRKSNSAQVVVLKVISNRSECASAQHEADIIQLVQGHPNVVTVHQVVEDRKTGRTGIAMEYHTGGTLLNLLVASCGCGLGEDTARNYFVQVVEAVQHVHSFGVAHRDIKAENILLSHDKQTAYLTDFGLSTKCRISQEQCGTLPYSAPEMLQQGKYEEGFDPKLCDVWALGVLLFGLATGHFPFHGNCSSDIADKITLAKVVFPVHVKLSLECKDLISSILVKNPEQRPRLSEILQHPFLATVAASASSDTTSGSASSECSSSRLELHTTNSGPPHPF
eukprot:c17749_g1_i1.p1 GENE.c17749_g1_i1~~c17749_g1_i1.p1  ORF type:complete len:319 (-),score=84.18 c17749_g1_i1:186-1142(-)